MVEDHCLQQLQKGLVENFESSGIGAAICLLEKKEAIPLLTEEAVEEHQDHNLPLPPTGSVYILPSPAPQSQPKTPTANAQATYNPLPGALYPEPLYTLPTTQFTPAAQFTLEASTTKARTSDLEHPNLGTSKLFPPPPPPPLPTFCFNFLALFYFIVFYFDFFNFSS